MIAGITEEASLVVSIPPIFPLTAIFNSTANAFFLGVAKASAHALLSKLRALPLDKVPVACVLNSSPAAAVVEYVLMFEP